MPFGIPVITLAQREKCLQIDFTIESTRASLRSPVITDLGPTKASVAERHAVLPPHALEKADVSFAKSRRRSDCLARKGGRYIADRIPPWIPSLALTYGKLRGSMLV